MVEAGTDEAFVESRTFPPLRSRSAREERRSRITRDATVFCRRRVMRYATVPRVPRTGRRLGG